jgi:CBS domain containing-hemolysin-like protein
MIATPMDMFITLLKPFVWILQISGDWLLKILHADNEDASLVHSTEELDMLVDVSYNEGVLNETEAEMLHNMFKFSDLMAKQVMIPRTDMICVPDDISYEEILDAIDNWRISEFLGFKIIINNKTIDKDYVTVHPSGTERI